MENMIARLIGEDIEIKTILSSDLMPIEVDPIQMEQMVINFLVNSRDALPKGGIVTIETSNMELDEPYISNHGVDIKPGSYVMFKISDTGTGMDKKTQSKIFEPFFTTKEKEKGTGLGLSTVYGIVKQNSGYIWVYSEPGKGTTFKVYLPSSEKTSKPVKKLQLTSDELEGNETILVVEDEKSVLDLVKNVLESYGYHVLVAQGGNEAISIFKSYQDQVQLVLTDVVMPIMSGRDLIEVLQSLKPEIKTIYMSGYTDNTIAHHGIIENGINFIEKPFSSKKIGLTVRQVLDAD